MTPDGLEFTLARGGAFAAAVLLMMLCEQVLVSSGALFVRGALEGAAAAGCIFNVLMVARAPLLLFQAVAASLLPHLTRLRTRGDATGDDAFRMSINNDPADHRLLRGRGHRRGARDRPRGDADRVRRQVHLRPRRPRDRRGRDGLLPLRGRRSTRPRSPRARRAARPPAGSPARSPSSSSTWSSRSTPTARSRSGSRPARQCSSGLLYLLYRRPHPIAGDALAPGSARELEAQLAAVDEIG